MNCGLLGRKLSHSYSPQIHNQLADYPYSLYEVEPEDLEAFLHSGQFTGLNVTIPYKKSVIPYCHSLSPQAQKLSSVNTIVKQADGSLIGHNTDYFGFRSMVDRTGLQLHGKKALILGSGGASTTAVAVMKELGAEPVVISRTGSNNYDNLDRHADAAVIINATPVGMYPNTDASPLSLDTFPHLEGVLDLIYNPCRTALLQQAESRGIVAQNGLWMLVAQAKESAEWFTGKMIADDVIPEIYGMLRKQMENLILIGMPGCGKSTVGKILAQKLGKSFVDADSEIERKAGMTIPEIFSQHGEQIFRQIETEILAELGKHSGLVIATGGGCVTREENYPLLHQNGTIVWLQRNLDHLPVDGRPLSKTGNLSQMYQQRQPLYRAFADHTVLNCGSPEEAVNTIIAQLYPEV